MDVGDRCQAIAGERALVLAVLGRVYGVVHRPVLAFTPGAADRDGGVGGLGSDEGVVAVDEGDGAVGDVRGQQRDGLLRELLAERALVVGPVVDDHLGVGAAEPVAVRRQGRAGRGGRRGHERGWIQRRARAGRPHRAGDRATVVGARPSAQEVAGADGERHDQGHGSHEGDAVLAVDAAQGMGGSAAAPGSSAGAGSAGVPARRRERLGGRVRLGGLGRARRPGRAPRPLREPRPAPARPTGELGSGAPVVGATGGSVSFTGSW